MILRRFYDDKLAHASYLVGCAGSGEALVIDPGRDVEIYLQAATEEGLRISDVTETHIHADFLSGARQLAERSGARLHLSGEGGPDWLYGPWADRAGAHLLLDGDTLQLGKVEIQVLHTPGHTPEHLSFLLYDRAAGDEPLGIFTGDFLFVGDVGRPDLLERAAGWTGTMEPGARRLYQSLQKLRDLPDWVQVWPAHGAGSACGKALGGLPSTTLGYERRTNWAFQIANEIDFVEEVLRGQPEPPRYFAQMKKRNKVGPPLLTHLPAPPRRSGAFGQGVQMVDIRPQTLFQSGHTEGALSLPLGRSFPTWAGSFLNYDQPIGIVAASAADAQEAARSLMSIGLDEVVGWASPGPESRTPSRLISVADAQSRNATLLDVRGRSEWQQGHISGALHIPLPELARRLSEVPRNGEVIVYCRSGARASVAASVLEQAGLENVSILQGSVAEWNALVPA